MRTYTEAERVQAIALPLADKEAAAQLGIPRRTVTYWRAQYREGRHSAATPILEATRQDIAAKLWEAVTVGTEEVLRRMRDPKARLSDVAQALRVVAEQHALLTGGATAR